jgi:hypothetical protein
MARSKKLRHALEVSHIFPWQMPTIEYPRNVVQFVNENQAHSTHRVSQFGEMSELKGWLKLWPRFAVMANLGLRVRHEG